MISSNDIRRSMLAVLDVDADTANDYYDDVRNIIPAINAAQKWLMILINSHFGEFKFGEFFFSDLHTSNVFRTSDSSRISLDSFPHVVGAITAVMPLPAVRLTGTLPPSMPDPKKSYWRSDYYHVSSNKPANRMSILEWSVSKNDPFAPGFQGLAADITDYAYLNPINYSPDGSVSHRAELEISPVLDKKLCTVFYIKQPQDLVIIGANDLPYHPNLFNLIRDKAVSYISWQNGDTRDSLFTVTDKDIRTLAALIN